MLSVLDSTPSLNTVYDPAPVTDCHETLTLLSVPVCCTGESAGVDGTVHTLVAAENDEQKLLAEQNATCPMRTAPS